MELHSSKHIKTPVLELGRGFSKSQPSINVQIAKASREHGVGIIDETLGFISESLGIKISNRRTWYARYERLRRALEMWRKSERWRTWRNTWRQHKIPQDTRVTLSGVTTDNSFWPVSDILPWVELKSPYASWIFQSVVSYAKLPTGLSSIPASLSTVSSWLIIDSLTFYRHHDLCNLFHHMQLVKLELSYLPRFLFLHSHLDLLDARWQVVSCIPSACLVFH